MKLVERSIYNIGQYGPFLLILASAFLLRNQGLYFNYYLIGTLVNIILNFLLKMMIREPRPSVDKKTFELALRHMKSKNYSNVLKYDVFGMPSGHAQSVYFSTIYLFLVLYKHKWTITVYFFLIICLITFYQRVKYEFHTVNQVLAGGFVGMIFAYLVYSFASSQMKAPLKPKKDDNGPI